MKELLNRMAVPCRDDGRKFTDDARLKAIACELVGTQWRVWRSDSLCRIYAREGFDPMKPTLGFSSHVDMVAQRCYADCQGDVWRGSFDNLITNAALVWDMREDLFGPQVLVAFTGDEEEDSHGADQVARILKGHGIPVQFIIATDVTEEGWDEGKSFTIENILPDEGQDVADALCWMLPLVLDLDPAPKVIVEGEVFAVDHRELKKRNAWVINFDITDYHSSVRINQFMEADKAKPQVGQLSDLGLVEMTRQKKRKMLKLE